MSVNVGDVRRGDPFGSFGRRGEGGRRLRLCSPHSPFFFFFFFPLCLFPPPTIQPITKSGGHMRETVLPGTHNVEMYSSAGDKASSKQLKILFVTDGKGSPRERNGGGWERIMRSAEKGRGGTEQKRRAMKLHNTPQHLDKRPIAASMRGRLLDHATQRSCSACTSLTNYGQARTHTHTYT
jgi:hypothetical protein